MTRPESTIKTFQYSESEISNKIVVSKQELSTRNMLEGKIQ
jgi:hypothetical protein